MNQYNDLRIIDRSTLASAQEAFLRSGKKIDELETPEFIPRPKRIEPQLTQEEIELRQMADQIRTLSATMFKLEMSKTMGISQDRIQKICKQFGIKLRNGSGRKPNSKGAYTIDPEEDKRLVERLRALAEVGVTKHKARAQVDIGWHKLQRLVEQYKLPFPSRAKCE
jgi:DNA-binding Xre family transcriptional regulator